MKTLVIGSTVCDVVIEVLRLPKVGEDENIIKQSWHIGGCAFNVNSILKLFNCNTTLFSPVGQGIYGQFIQNQLSSHNIPILIKSQADNGCCYCVVDKTGERTFICEHGAEYIFKTEYFDRLESQEYDQVYICGLEIEEKTGDHIITYLEKSKITSIFFAPGPRICEIDKEKMQRLFALHPILHLNKRELQFYTNETNIEKAAKKLMQMTGNTIIVTLGDKGAFYMTETNCEMICTTSIKAIDTIGAGDAHIGAIMACLCFGCSLHTAITIANRISSLIVQKSGATLTVEEFSGISNEINF